MTAHHSAGHVLGMAAAIVAALHSFPAAHRLPPARAVSADPFHCTAPTRPGQGKGLNVQLDWPRTPVPPGTAQALGIRITNIAGTASTQQTTVTVHNFAPNTMTAEPGVTLTPVPGGVSFVVPAGLSPGVTITRTLVVKLGPSIPTRATEHCDVTAVSGKDQAVVPYDVVTGDPVVHPTAAVLPITAKAGQRVLVGLILGNAGPSNEYTGPAVFTLGAPAHTTWVSPSAYGCHVDARATTLTCQYQGAPLTGRQEFEQPPLKVASGVLPGTTLPGGSVQATDPYAPEVFHGAPFSVVVPR